MKKVERLEVPYFEEEFHSITVPVEKITINKDNIKQLFKRLKSYWKLRDKPDPPLIFDSSLWELVDGKTFRASKEEYINAYRYIVSCGDGKTLTNKELLIDFKDEVRHGVCFNGYLQAWAALVDAVVMGCLNPVENSISVYFEIEKIPNKIFQFVGYHNMGSQFSYGPTSFSLKVVDLKGKFDAKGLYHSILQPHEFAGVSIE